MSARAPRRSVRKRTEPERFRFSQFVRAPAIQEGRLIFQTSQEPEPATPRTPVPAASSPYVDAPEASESETSEPLERFKQDLARMGGFAVVNDRSASDDEASYKDN